MSEKIRPTVAEINLGNLRYNFQSIKSHIGNTKLLCVIKADAYGHGIKEYAKVLSELGADYFGVAIVEEGIELRKSGIKEPILVLGDIVEEQIKLFFDYDLDFTVSSDVKMWKIDSMAKLLNKRARAHIKIDTGMGRIGVNHARVFKYINAYKKTENIDIVGTFSHFARSTESEEYTRLQFKRFNNAVKELEEGGINCGMKHMCNSGATLRYPEMMMDMVRVGIMLHGVFPDNNPKYKIPLKPVLTLKTKVVYFKTMSPGQYVSYGSTWEPKVENERIVTLPLGYADGFGRRAKTKSCVLINGKKYPVVGKICMDQCMVSLGKNGEAYPGDEVILIGEQGEQKVRVEDMAEQNDEVVYEIFIRISKRVPRVYIDVV